jgi:adenylate cyclase
MVLHPRYKRYFRQTLAFGFIWLVFGLVYAFLEKGLLGPITEYPSTGNKYDFKNSLIYTGIFTFLTGLAQGLIEVVWLKKRLAKFSFRKKIILKSAFYLSFIVLFLIVLTLTTNAQRYDADIFDPAVLGSLWQFMRTFAFWSVVIYAGVILDIALFYSEMVEYLGNGVIYNYSFGKYHKPKQEIRIFMFLDMKSSTTIAEKMGHKEYFDLIKAYYADMTDSILETSGEIYQYVGDEIVVSWSAKNGLYKNNCIECFRKLVEVFERKQANYTNEFGLMPSFKAGYHIGEVTTGEIGIIKKDIIFTGDALNTTARIQGLCNKYDVDILISEDLITALQLGNEFQIVSLGKNDLRGKVEDLELFTIKE